MDKTKRLGVAFLWHMHQPFYKDNLTGKYLLPWVRLHGVKDYYPMAELAGRFDGLSMCFNMVPSLVEQILDYAENGATDTWLDLTLKKASQLAPDDKIQILNNFFSVNADRFIKPNPRYSELLSKKGPRPMTPSAFRLVARHISPSDFLDLQVLFNLAWFHSITVDEDSNLKDIIEKGRHYSEEDKEYVMVKQREVMSSIIPLYKKLEESGRIEITTTPYYHPIMPLLCDTSIAGASSPGMPLPKPRFSHPEDVSWHVEEAVKYHTRIFGRAPAGMWPSEGSVSDETLEILISKGIKWVATDEDILFRSLAPCDRRRAGKAPPDRRLIYQPYSFRKGSKRISMIFRDKNLSDMISFNYNSWDPIDAANDLLGHLGRISDNMRRDTDRGIAAIVMDGENAWDYYPDNGRAFFETLYSKLDTDDRMGSTTISDYLGTERRGKALSGVFPGSWINHNFEIWIGQEQDNISWGYLDKARKDLVKFTASASGKGPASDPDASAEKAWRELYIAEGSDWNWWYKGRAGSGGDVGFDRLYRTHLKNIYKLMKKPVPDFLKISIV